MDIAKLCMKNVLIRDCKVKRVCGIYVRGIKNSLKSPYESMRKLRESRKLEILDEYRKAPLDGRLYSDVERKIDQKFVLRAQRKKPWHGQCPYSSKGDIPFDHGCEVFAYSEYLDRPAGKSIIFYLIGKNQCKKLQDCAVRLGRMLGMNPKIEYLEGMERHIAEIDIKRVLTHEITNLY